MVDAGSVKEAADAKIKGKHCRNLQSLPIIASPY
jgi:hypothetical protein